MGRKGTGAEVRDNAIRVQLTFNGKVLRRTLNLDGKPLQPTAANPKYAHRLAAEIRGRIRFGSLSLAEYFTADGDVGQPLTVRPAAHRRYATGPLAGWLRSASKSRPMPAAGSSTATCRRRSRRALISLAKPSTTTCRSCAKRWSRRSPTRRTRRTRSALSPARSTRSRCRIRFHVRKPRGSSRTWLRTTRRRSPTRSSSSSSPDCAPPRASACIGAMSIWPASTCSCTARSCAASRS